MHPPNTIHHGNPERASVMRRVLATNPILPSRPLGRGAGGEGFGAGSLARRPASRVGELSVTSVVGGWKANPERERRGRRRNASRFGREREHSGLRSYPVAHAPGSPRSSG